MPRSALGGLSGVRAASFASRADSRRSVRSWAFRIHGTPKRKATNIRIVPLIGPILWIASINDKVRGNRDFVWTNKRRGLKLYSSEGVEGGAIDLQRRGPAP